MSKTYAMSGLRLGYIVINDAHTLDRIKKLVRCTINGVNSVTQYGAAAALNGPQDATRSMTREYQMRRDVLFDALDLTFTELRFRRDPACPVCSNAAVEARAAGPANEALAFPFPAPPQEITA